MLVLVPDGEVYRYKLLDTDLTHKLSQAATQDVGAEEIYAYLRERLSGE